jgi:hypothetical protein
MRGAKTTRATALTHDSCNRSKQAANLRAARLIACFDKTRAGVRLSEGRGANLSDVLSRFGGVEHDLRFKVTDGQLTYSAPEPGDNSLTTTPVYDDKLSRTPYCFTILRIEYLHHDSRINPRNIGRNLCKLVSDFHRGRPQLHVSPGWIDVFRTRGAASP